MLHTNKLPSLIIPAPPFSCPQSLCHGKIQSLMSIQKNVLGQPLRVCCKKPMTGFYRNGLCETDTEDHGSHTVCAIMTAEFLTFSKSRGNDLSTPAPRHGFPGLKAGDCWCLCAARWQEALDAGMAPQVKLSSCHEACLQFVRLEDLQSHAVPEGERG